MFTRRGWDPFRELEAIRREVDRVFNDVASGRWPLPRFAFLPGEAARAYPLLNISADEDNVYVEALAPGLDPQSINVEVVRDQLTLSGEKPGLKDVKPEDVHRSERAAGRFMRSMTLPYEVDLSKATADYKNGLLHITLPKAEMSKPKRISVAVS
ncbi:MAG: Hsp20/alpha crystallin family protein [Candidatus Sumerlaeia bacterium]